LNSEIKNEFTIERPPAGRWWHARLAWNCFVCVFALLADRGLAQSSATQTNTNAPAELGLEDLINIQVTSVSKKEEKLNDAPAAISVLTGDDLHRSGATSVAEALRLVPGMDVGQVNAYTWAVSARGFNGQFANKLLVMVDGRSVYTPLFSGVYWDLQQQILDDLDRVEVIRGPGGSIWGANAVNGVINVVSKSAKDTQGALVYGSGGDVHLTMDGGRYGGMIGSNTYYRVFGSYQKTDDYQLSTNGGSAMDNWWGGEGGFRIDHYRGSDTHLTWQADATKSEIPGQDNDAYNANTIGRWTRELSDRSSVEVQAYYDRFFRDYLVNDTIDTLDFAAQHTFGLGEHNDIIWGIGYRFISSKVETIGPVVAITKGNYNQQIFSLFGQDEFKIIPEKLTITLGTKIEHNDITGFEFQPTVRAVFKPAENQTVWASVSRALRTPSDYEGRDLARITTGPPTNGPGGGFYLPQLVGNPDLESEVLWAYEAGYRIQPDKRVNVDLAVFYNDYSGLVSGSSPPQFVPGVPIGTATTNFVNGPKAQTYGGELAVTFAPSDTWRLTASYSLLHEHLDPGIFLTGTGDPEHQITLRSAYDFTKRASFDAQLRYVDGFPGVSSYVTADLRLSYRPIDSIELSIVAQNLFQDQHREQPGVVGTLVSQVPRGFYGKLTWRF